MPVYEYRCNDCFATFELLRPMAQRELQAVCPSCEGRTTMPLISRVAVRAPAAATVHSAAPRPSTGGCCGGGCGCGA